MSLSHALLSALVLASSLSSHLALAATPSARIRARLEATIPPEMAMRNLPGAAVVVVDTSGFVFAEGYGLADLETGEVVDIDRTVFRVASVSKIFTATAVMQLVERGTLDLDRGVGRYLEGVTLEAGVAQQVTLRHLLTHTAGFGARFLGYRAEQPSDRIPLRAYLGSRLPRPFIAPGQIISYANHGTALAGLVVQSASGRPFERYIEEEILSALSMRDSGARLEPGHLEALATGYVHSAGRLVRVRPSVQHATPAGSFVATARDMGRFGQAFLRQGRGEPGVILAPETVAAMMSRQFTHHPQMTGVGLGFFEHAIEGRTAWGHDGDTGGHNARLLLIPELGVGIFLAYTGTDPTKRFADAVTRAMLRAYEPPPPPSALADEPISAELRAQVPGTYRWTRYARDTAEKAFLPYPFLQYHVETGNDGEIVVSQTPIQLGPPVRLRFVGDRLFQSADGATLASFREDSRGRISHLLYDGIGVLPMAFERVRWFQRLEVQGLALLLFLSGFVAAGARASWQKWRGQRAPGGRWVIAVSAANLAFLALFPVTFGLSWFSDYLPLPALLTSPWPPRFVQGASPLAVALLALPLAGLVASATLVGSRLAGYVPMRTGWLVGFSLLEFAFALFLWEWNLLGYRL